MEKRRYIPSENPPWRVPPRVERSIPSCPNVDAFFKIANGIDLQSSNIYSILESLNLPEKCLQSMRSYLQQKPIPLLGSDAIEFKELLPSWLEITFSPDEIKRAIDMFAMNDESIDLAFFKRIASKADVLPSALIRVMLSEDYKEEKVNRIRILLKLQNRSSRTAEFDIVSDPAFAVDYQNYTQNIRRFERYFTETLNLFNRNVRNYHSFFFSIVQSSGYGKSRMLFEASKKTLNVVYCCLRDSRTRECPLRTTKIADIIFKYNSVESYKLLIATIYMVALEYTVECYEDRNPTETDNLALYSVNTDPIESQEFWDAVAEDFEHSLKDLNFRKQLMTNYIVRTKNFCSEKRKNKKYGLLDYDIQKPILSELLIVFDEARNLTDEPDPTRTSLFQKLMQAQRELNWATMNGSVALVFVDTKLSRVNVCDPGWIMDSSARPKAAFNLLPNFYQMQTFDSCADAVLAQGPDYERTEALARLYARGRPLWYAFFFRDFLFSSSITQAIRFARGKLTFSDENSRILSDEAKVAVVAVRFGINSVTDYNFASTLMSSYMATGICIENDRLIVAYPAEPVLSEAACQTLYSGIVDLTTINNRAVSFRPDVLKGALTQFTSHYTNGLVDAGKSSELIARVILSVAYDIVRLLIFEITKKEKNISSRMAAVSIDEKKPAVYSANIDFHRCSLSDPKTCCLFSDPILLGDFLKQLVSDKYLNEWKKTNGCPLYKLSDGLAKAEIAFTTFTFVPVFPQNGMTQELLKKAFDSRTGLVLKSNQESASIVFPLRLVTGIFSYLLVQIKDRLSISTADRLNDASWKLTPTKCLSPAPGDIEGKVLKELEEKKDYVVIFMEIEFEKTSVPDLGSLANQFHSTYPTHLVLAGMDTFDFLGKHLVPILRLIHYRTIDTYGINSQANDLRVMHPIAAYFAGRSCGCKIGVCKDRRCSCVNSQLNCNASCSCQGICKGNPSNINFV